MMRPGPFNFPSASSSSSFAKALLLGRHTLLLLASLPILCGSQGRHAVAQAPSSPLLSRLRAVETLASGELIPPGIIPPPFLDISALLPQWTANDWQSDGLAASRAYVASLIQARLDFNSSNLARRYKNNNIDPFYPACLIFDNANALDDACSFLRLFRAATSTLRLVFKYPLNSEYPANPSGELPRPLTFDTRSSSPPRLLHQSTVADERPTYYYLYRLIFRLYKHAYDYEDAVTASSSASGSNGSTSTRAPPVLPLIAPGWEQQQVYYLDYPLQQQQLPASRIPGRQGGGAGRRTTPFAVSVVQGDRMVLVFRGTVFEEEWSRDWQYHYSTDPLASELFPGRVHHGVFSIFKMAYKQIEQEVLRVRPRHVLVAGHSLGGVNAMLHGYHIQQLLTTLGNEGNEGEEDYLPRVDVVTIGAPLVGDADFVAATGRVLNQRSIVYLGGGGGASGGDGSFMIRIGDPIPQYTCGPFLGCDRLGTGPDGTLYSYARPACLVAFTSRDLVNHERWHEVESLFLTAAGTPIVPSMHGIAAVHLCSYMCYLHKGGSGDGNDGDYSLCYFKDQERAVGLPDRRLCYFPEIPF